MGTLVVRTCAARRAADAAAAHLRRRQRAGRARRLHARRARMGRALRLEEDDLRRAPDLKHYRLAQQLRRTLVTLDRDYLDDRRFPPDEGGGVLVIQRAGRAPAARRCSRASTASLFHARRATARAAAAARGRKLQVHTDWGRGRRVIVARRAPSWCCPTASSSPARSSSTTGASSTSGRAPCQAGRRRRRSRSTVTTSCPGSSTCTCTASTASIRWTTATPIARDGRAAAALRRHRVLPDDGRLRARRRCGACSSRCGARARAAAAARRARAAGAPRKQLHQPRVPRRAAGRLPAQSAGGARRWAGWRRAGRRQSGGAAETFDGADILREIERAAPDVGIVTLAPELEGGLDLIAWLTSRGHRVSLGHSGATYEQALAAIAAGARHATHLFNRMPPLDHRAPGSPAPSCRPTRSRRRSSATAFTSIRRWSGRRSPPSGRQRILAITDGTAAAGLPAGSQAMLGGRPITARNGAAISTTARSPAAC